MTSDEEYHEAIAELWSILEQNGVPKPEPEPEDLVLEMLESALPEMMDPRNGYRCPDQGCGHFSTFLTSLYHVVIHLNDEHHWHREQIADWLDGLDIDLSFKVPEEE